MKLVIDIETNSLGNPSKVWVICARDIEKGTNYVFREPSDYSQVRDDFLQLAEKVETWIGHNWLEYDYPVLRRLLGLHVPNVAERSVDTLVMSRLVNFSRPHSTDGDLPTGAEDDLESASLRSLRGHSIESYGQEFRLEKLDFSDYSKYSKEMEVYCARDVEICAKIYKKLQHIIDNPVWRPSILLEQRFQYEVVNQLQDNGFAFNIDKAKVLLERVTKELAGIDAEITEAFPDKQVLIREFTPKATKHGTISKTSVPRNLWPTIAQYEVGKTYPVYGTVQFNPSSHKQLISVLNDAGWRPEDKTQTHINTEREINRLKYSTRGRPELDNQLKLLQDKLEILKKTGWKIGENNLSTLPETAPAPTRLLAKRILLESRRRTLTEWLGLVSDDGRIHGRYYGIGAWTHRMAHQKPNTANIPNEFDTQGNVKLLGKELRQLWQAPRNRLLVGVDAEGIQLRIFAHYIDDPEFTDALVRGKKDDKSDPHSLNQRILGSVCKSRSAAKRFIYALLLGAGLSKLSQVLECGQGETTEALERLLRRYQGWASLKEESIPKDAIRGYFIGLDGRKVRIPGTTVGERKHLCMSGYLQNGEAVVMKAATLKWMQEIEDAYPPEFDRVSLSKRSSITIPQSEDQVTPSTRPKLVNLVHDEWQSETKNRMDIAVWLAERQCRALREVGEELKLKCPLAGSYWNDDHKDYTIGTNWYQTH